LKSKVTPYIARGLPVGNVGFAVGPKNSVVRQLGGGLGRRQVEGAEVAQYVHDVAGKCKSLIDTKGRDEGDRPPGPRDGPVRRAVLGVHAALRHPARSAHEVGNRGLSDVAQLAFAAREGRLRILSRSA
jgi:hypothetical protein